MLLTSDGGTTRRHKCRRVCSLKASVRTVFNSLVRQGLQSLHSKLEQLTHREAAHRSGNTTKSLNATSGCDNNSSSVLIPRFHFKF